MSGHHPLHSAVKLESPTSISMKNSLIIKTGDANFENYYKSMIKRKMG